MADNQYPTPPQGRLFQPSQDPGTGGFRIDYTPSARAQEAAGIPIDPFVDAAGAGQYVGQGLENLGEGLQKITGMMVESMNRRAVTKGDINILQAEKEIGDAMGNERDPRKWAAISDGIAQKWQEASLADKDLLPGAREAIMDRFTKWRIDGARQTAALALKRTHQLETEELEGIRLTALDNGDPVTANKATDDQEARGLIGKDTAARQRIHTKEVMKQKELDAKAAAFDKHEENVIIAARTMPTAKVLEMIDMPGFAPNMSQDDKEKLRNRARSVGNNESHQELGQIADGIASGEITSEAQIEALAKKSPFLTPSLVQQANEMLDKQNLIADANDREKNGSENFAALYQEAMGYNPAKDPERKEYLRIMTDARRKVGDKDDGLIRQIMYRKVSAVAPPLKPAEATKDAVRQSIGAVYDAQLQPYKRELAKAEARLNREDGDTPENKKAVEDATKAYNEKRLQVIRSQGATQRKMDDWLKQNPKAEDSKVWDQLKVEQPDANAPAAVDALYDDPSPNAVPSPDDEDETAATDGDEKPAPGQYKIATYVQQPDGTVTQKNDAADEEKKKKEKKREGKPSRDDGYEEPDLPEAPGAPSNALFRQ